MALTRIEIKINGELLESGYVEGERVLAPLEPFCDRLGAEVKNLEGPGHTAICRGDMCIPLNAGELRDTKQIDGAEYVYLDSLEDGLNLHVYQNSEVAVITTKSTERGLSPGDVPPEFTLPDLFSGDLVASSDFLGRKVVFYMWASW